MLEVFTVLSGALIVFLSLVLWANDGRFKSDSAHEND
jgi:hypothetical protein